MVGSRTLNTFKHGSSCIVRGIAHVWMLVRDLPGPSGSEIMYIRPSRSASEAWDNHFGFNRSYRPDDYDRRKKDMKAAGWRARRMVIGPLT